MIATDTSREHPSEALKLRMLAPSRRCYVHPQFRSQRGRRAFHATSPAAFTGSAWPLLPRIRPVHAEQEKHTALSLLYHGSDAHKRNLVLHVSFAPPIPCS